MFQEDLSVRMAELKCIEFTCSGADDAGDVHSDVERRSMVDGSFLSSSQNAVLVEDPLPHTQRHLDVEVFRPALDTQ